MASKKQTGWKWKDVGISVDSKVIKNLPKNPKKMDGMKKGSGQLPSGFTTGVSGATPAAEGLDLFSAFMRLSEAAPALEDITDERPVTSDEQHAPDVDPVSPESSNEAPASDEPVPIGGAEVGGEPGADRYVKGAHLISKTQTDAADFEELWIYRIDRSAPDEAGKILKSILAGTDIPENKTRSDDGKQTYSVWTAGNAQYVSITGLSN